PRQSWLLEQDRVLAAPERVGRKVNRGVHDTAQATHLPCVPWYVLPAGDVEGVPGWSPVWGLLGGWDGPGRLPRGGGPTGTVMPTDGRVPDPRRTNSRWTTRSAQAVSACASTYCGGRGSCLPSTRSMRLSVTVTAGHRPPSHRTVPLRTMATVLSTPDRLARGARRTP